MRFNDHPRGNIYHQTVPPESTSLNDNRSLCGMLNASIAPSPQASYRWLNGATCDVEDTATFHYDLEVLEKRVQARAHAEQKLALGRYSFSSKTLKMKHQNRQASHQCQDENGTAKENLPPSIIDVNQIAALLVPKQPKKSNVIADWNYNESLTSFQVLKAGNLMKEEIEEIMICDKRRFQKSAFTRRYYQLLRTVLATCSSRFQGHDPHGFIENKTKPIGSISEQSGKTKQISLRQSDLPSRGSIQVSRTHSNPNTTLYQRALQQLAENNTKSSLEPRLTNVKNELLAKTERFQKGCKNNCLVAWNDDDPYFSPRRRPHENAWNEPDANLEPISKVNKECNQQKQNSSACRYTSLIRSGSTSSLHYLPAKYCITVNKVVVKRDRLRSINQPNQR